MGGVHGFGVGGVGDVDISAPLGSFGNTGGHRQDLDSAGAYVVAGPEGDDISHALGAANPNRHDSTFQTYVAEQAPADEEASTLTSGGHPNSNAPGRKREDDENLVVARIHPCLCPPGEPHVCHELAEARPEHYYVGPGKDEDGALRVGGTDSGGGHDNVPVVAEQRAFSVTPEGGQGADLAATETDVGSVGTPRGRWDRGTFIASSGVQQSPSGEVSETEELSPPILGRGGSVAHNSPMVYTENPDGKVYEGDEAAALQTTHGASRQVVVDEDVSATLKGQRGRGGGGIGPEETLVSYGLGSHAGSNGEASNESHAAGGPVGQGIVEEGTPALRAARVQAVAYTKTHGSEGGGDAELWGEADVARTRNSLQHASDVVVEDDVAPVRGSAVRRLSPVECERLQGFPDGWTDLEPGATPDGPRYSALGDAVTVNVSYWVVRRLLRRRELGLE